MTPEQIRAEAIERIARAEYTSWLERVQQRTANWGTPSRHRPWDEQPDEGDWGRDHWRRIQEAAVDALGDMLPTELEIERGLWAERFDGSRHRLEPDRYRYTTPWREATDAPITKDINRA